MIIARKEVTYQQAGTTSSKASPPDISKETNSNTSFNHTFSRSKREHHPLVLNKTLMLVAWQVSWRYYLSRYFLRKQPSLFLSQEVKGLVNIVH